jgi:glycosyltransferase involved in cell wall biosynthesis
MVQPAPILVVGDAVASTGFARVTEAVLRRLHPRYEIHQLGINYFGDPHDAPWPIYRAGLRGDAYGINRLQELIDRCRPRLVLLVEDIWFLARYVPILTANPQLRSIAYLPIDGAPVEPSIAAQLASLDQLVVYNRFGAATLEAALAAGPPLRRPLASIPHGVDRGVFRPLAPDPAAARAEARRRLLPDRPEFRDGFIVLNANRNQPRKRIDITLQGFARFAAGKPDTVKLYLHMGVEDVGWNLMLLARRLGIEDRLILTGAGEGVPEEPPERLNLIYNACQVGLNTALGEGWGLVAFEHAATGAVQIVPRHTACAELWDGAAEMLEPVFSVINERVLTDGHFVSERDVAAALERLYRDPALLAERSAAAFANATRAEYDWDAIAARWDALFQAVLAG